MSISKYRLGRSTSVALMASAAVIALPGVAAFAAGFHVETNVRGEAMRWSGTDGADSGVVFRWRADGNATGSDTVNNSPTKAYGGPPVYSIPHPPFRSFPYVQFGGANDAIAGTKAIDTASKGGFTVIAWLRADQGPTNSQKIFSTTEGGKGFALSETAGVVRGTYTYTPTGGAATRITLDGNTNSYDPPATAPRVSDGTWHQVAFTASNIGNYQPPGAASSLPTLRARIYIDGNLEAQKYTQVAANATFTDSTSVPSIGAEATSNVPDSEWFQGKIQAVQVFNYNVDNNYLSTVGPRDGGVYFGLPSYHDYTPGTATYGHGNTANMTALSDRSLSVDGTSWTSDMTTQMKARISIPYLNEGYVPQGVAVSDDGTHMFMASYYRSDANVSGGKPVIVTDTDLTTKKVVAVYQLANGPSNTHAGGIAVVNNQLYTGSTGKTLYRYSLASRTLVTAAQPLFDIPAVYSVSYDWSAGLLGAYTSASFSALTYTPVTKRFYAMGYYNSVSTPDQPTPDNPDANDILGMPLNADGTVGAVDEVHRVPVATDYNQGVAIMNATVGGSPDASCFLLAHSDNVPGRPKAAQYTSLLKKWCVGDSSTKTVAQIPGGAENLYTGQDGTVWVQSENPAHYYQKRDSGVLYWDRYTPYVAGFPLTSLQ